MMLASSRVATAVDLAAARRQRAGAPAREAAGALVLFVGSGCRPAAAQSDLLARDGLRSLWLPTLERAIEASAGAQLDALVLDASAHDAAALARARAALRCPLLVLADDGDEVDEIMALELGADAFLRRPVSPRRLRAHLTALLRPHRKPAGVATEAAPQRSEHEDWRVDRVANRLHRGATVVPLTEAQGAFLQCLLDSQGRIVSRDCLIAALPIGASIHARSIDVYIHRLRKRLHAAGVFDLLIEAIRGRGYVLQLQR
jgi:DNA-binding response OmpR family regulator